MADLETEVELLKSKVSDMEKLHVRLDDAIGKISEVSNCINRMLAVHEEKLANQAKELETSEKASSSTEDPIHAQQQSEQIKMLQEQFTT